MERGVPQLDFEVLIDESFANINPDETINPTANKKVLSLINDFEDEKWRFSKFQNFIWDNIVHTSLSQYERESLVNKSHSLLTAAAANLRLTDAEDDISKGSELAEIVLYGIMKHHYDALPIVPKIFYKQNVQDNAKGADSVHIVIEKDESDFSIWFGEAKFYNSVEDARLGSIVKSVENSLQTDKLKKENSIVTSIGDIDLVVENEILRKNIKKLLSPRESIDDLKAKLQIPILLLHECEITKGVDCLSVEYKDQIKDYHSQRAQAYFKKQIQKFSRLHKYSEIRFHLILFPVPSKKEIVDKFVSTVEFYKNQ